MKVIVVLCLLAACTYAQQLPPFLQGAPPNIVAEFRQMLSGANQQTDAQMEQQIEAWANRQSPQIRVSSLTVSVPNCSTLSLLQLFKNNFADVIPTIQATNVSSSTTG